MQTQIRIEVNGEGRTIDAGTTVGALVQQLGLRPEVVAIEVNERLVSRDARAAIELRAGDRVEVVTLVGGG